MVVVALGVPDVRVVRVVLDNALMIVLVIVGLVPVVL